MAAFSSIPPEVIIQIIEVLAHTARYRFLQAISSTSEDRYDVSVAYSWIAATHVSRASHDVALQNSDL